MSERKYLSILYITSGDEGDIILSGFDKAEIVSLTRDYVNRMKDNEQSFWEIVTVDPNNDEVMVWREGQLIT